MVVNLFHWVSVLLCFVWPDRLKTANPSTGADWQGLRLSVDSCNGLAALHDVRCSCVGVAAYINTPPPSSPKDHLGTGKFAPVSARGLAETLFLPPQRILFDWHFSGQKWSVWLLCECSPKLEKCRFLRLCFHSVSVLFIVSQCSASQTIAAEIAPITIQSRVKRSSFRVFSCRVGGRLPRVR
jgi:hypothetical protein